MAQLIAKRYGTALYETAVENGAVEQFEQEVLDIISILKQEKDLINVLNHPQILMDDKIQLLEQVFQGKISNEILGLMILGIQKGRQAYILKMLEYFLGLVKVYKGIVTATIYSAIPLKDMQIAEIKIRIEERLGKQVEVVTEVDPALIGGIKVRIGDQILDNSIQGKLDALKTQLSKIQLA